MGVWTPNPSHSRYASDLLYSSEFGNKLTLMPFAMLHKNPVCARYQLTMFTSKLATKCYILFCYINDNL